MSKLHKAGGDPTEAATKRQALKTVVDGADWLEKQFHRELGKIDASIVTMDELKGQRHIQKREILERLKVDYDEKVAAEEKLVKQYIAEN